VVEFESPDQAQKAIAMFNGQQVRVAARTPARVMVPWPHQAADVVCTPCTSQQLFARVSLAGKCPQLSVRAVMVKYAYGVLVGLAGVVSD
jgi:hypothetical protein